jgi:hypothetical protein
MLQQKTAAKRGRLDPIVMSFLFISMQLNQKKSYAHSIKHIPIKTDQMATK